MLMRVPTKDIHYHFRMSPHGMQVVVSNGHTRTHDTRTGPQVKLRKKLLSVAAIAALGLTTVSGSIATASAATPTPGDFGRSGVWVCKSYRTGDITWPVAGRCPRGTEKVLWQTPRDNGHDQRGVALETITMNLGSGGTVKCWDNRSRDPKNPVFDKCVTTGRLAQVLSPAPQPTVTPTRPQGTPTPGPRR